MESLFYFLVLALMLYILVYLASKHAMKNVLAEREVSEESHKTDLLMELNDMGIINDNELESLITYYENTIPVENKKSRLIEYVALLRDIHSKQLIEIDNIDVVINDLENYSWLNSQQ